MKPQIYRGFINQPSEDQPLHRFHGKYCIVEDYNELNVRIHFTEGKTFSTTAPRLAITRIKISSAED